MTTHPSEPTEPTPDPDVVPSGADPDASAARPGHRPGSGTALRA